MPLTEEEKKQRKLEKKAQKIREAEELRMRTRKEELGREIQTSQRIVAENMKQWYLRNYAARFPFIVQDMEVAWHSFEHTLDVKEFIIAELMGKMDESKIQEAMSWQDYIIKIDNMIGDFQSRIDELGIDYQGRLSELIGESLKISMLQKNTQDNLEDYYKTILFIMENKFSEAMITAQGEYVTKRDEQAKKGVHNVEEMSAALEKSLQNTVADIRDTLEKYKEDTETKRKNLEALKAKDDFYTDMIKRQDTRMTKLIDELSSLQSQVNERHESQVALEDLKKDKEETYAEYRKARAKLNRENTLDQNQLLTLTSESNNVIQDLQHILEKGEKILRLGALCRKLETQEEKVFPFGTPSELNSKYLKEEDAKTPFILFWQRFAHVNLIKRKLEPTLEALHKENQELRDCLEATFEIIAMTRV